MLSDKITTIVVNYKTKALTETCVAGFVKCYPDVHMVLVDNRSEDDSSEFCKRFAQAHEQVTLMTFPKNIGHGPAMHAAVKKIATDYFFTLDSDCIIRQCGFLEKMLEQLASNDKLYAVGWLRYVNMDGVAASGKFDSSKLLPYIHPHAAMFKRDAYFKLDPFVYHGAPCICNMRTAKVQGYAVKDFPVKDYIEHLAAGTRRMWKGAWDIEDKPPVREWRKNDNYPV